MLSGLRHDLEASTFFITSLFLLLLYTLTGQGTYKGNIRLMHRQVDKCSEDQYSKREVGLLRAYGQKRRSRKGTRR